MLHKSKRPFVPTAVGIVAIPMFYLMGFGHYQAELSGGLPISRPGHVPKGRLGTKNEYNGAPNDISTREF